LVELVVDTSKPLGEIDLTRYALGQGGLSDKPMFDSHVEQIAQLHPQTIRLFVQEYFNLYPERGRYHWATLDKAIETILATGAKPLLCLCFKPKALFPNIDQDIVHPTDYADWEKLISRLVKHCNRDRRFAIAYWEIANEPDIGEDGGCPYRFKPADYVIYYTHAAKAILRVDPHAKVGGPALAGYKSAIGEALLEHCAKGEAPLHFFSWHIYSSDVGVFRRSIQDVKAKLAKHPQLTKVETVLDEWNMSLEQPVLEPAFQPAFVLEVTRAFHQEGLIRGAYYHIRDSFVDAQQYSPWMSKKGTSFMANWWNVMPQYDGLFDNLGQVRPAYYAFKLLSLIKGEQLALTGTTTDVNGFAVKSAGWTHVVFWNFPPTGKGETVEATVRFPATHSGRFRLVRLNPEARVNQLELLRHGRLAELEQKPMQTTLRPHEIRWVELSR
jgi:hypothetical protein